VQAVGEECEECDKKDAAVKLMKFDGVFS